MTSDNTQVISDKTLNNNSAESSEKRNYGLDYLRFIAIMMIFTFHYGCTYELFSSPIVIFKNGAWGCPGTTVFFILSGFLLRKKYEVVSDIKVFYQKRFLAIFPAFYIAFIPCYLVCSIFAGNFLFAGSPLKFIYTLLGIDNYLGFYGINTYALVGEWFTAIIIVAYLIYPLLSFFFNKNKYIVMGVITVLYLVNVFFGIDPVVADASVFSGIFLFTLGMLFSDTFAKIKRKYIVLPISVAISILIIFVNLPDSIPETITSNLLGISLFTAMYLLFTWFSATKPFSGMNKAAKYLSSLSYCIYLSHHFVLRTLFEKFEPHVNTTASHFANYMIQLLITLVISIALNAVTKAVIRFFGHQRVFKKTNS